MATCKDCLHVDVCRWSYLPPTAEQCVDFKDKAKYVKIGENEPLTLDELRQMDADVDTVEVVRCNTCEYCNPFGECKHPKLCSDDWQAFLQVDGDDFCSYGVPDPKKQKEAAKDGTPKN